MWSPKRNMGGFMRLERGDRLGLLEFAALRRPGVGVHADQPQADTQGKSDRFGAEDFSEWIHALPFHLRSDLFEDFLLLLQDLQLPLDLLFVKERLTMGLAYRVESRLPGRVRLRSVQLERLGLPKAQVERFFMAQKGVRDPRYSAAIGSLILHVDATFIDDQLDPLLEARFVLRRKIADLETERTDVGHASQALLVHSMLAASMLLRLPFTFYAVGALISGRTRLQNALPSLIRRSPDERLPEGAALLTAIATGRPPVPIMMLWFDSLEALLLARRHPLVYREPTDTQRQTLDTAYTEADRAVLPVMILSGISCILNGQRGRSAAVLSINRRKNVRLPERTGNTRDTRLLRRTAEGASAAILTGLLPPTAATLAVRSVRLYATHRMTPA